jgi:putative phosphoesterase
VTRSRPFVAGVISDTHGLLRPEAVEALRGVDHILHAGDVGDAAVLEALRGLAPVTAVRGNNDRGPWAEALPLTATVALGTALVYMVHDLADLDLALARAGMRALVTGHSHRPLVGERDGVLHLNPGSAGPRRFSLPITVARLEVNAAGAVSARIVPLAVPARR